MDNNSTFLPRKQMWQMRQNLTDWQNQGHYTNETRLLYEAKHSSNEFHSEDSWRYTDYSSRQSTTDDAFNSNTNKYSWEEPKQYSCEYFQQCHIELLETFKTCPKCKYPDPSYFDFVTDDDDFILGKSCKKCKDCFIGIDDTQSIHDIEKLLKLMKAPLCSCGNEDVNQYVFEQNSVNSEILQLRCCACGNIVSSSDSNTNNESYTEDNFTMNEDLCPCHSTNPDDYTVQFDDITGHVISINCNRCNSMRHLQDELQEVPVTSKPSHSSYSIKHSKPSGKRRAYNAKHLKAGDHICFWRTLRWEHHAIVKNCNVRQNKITVIHYYPPQDKKAKGLVLETEICLDQDHPDAKGSAEGILYVVDYNGPTFDPQVVVSRATERLGEQKYNFFTHNCEHFARWCKTNASGILKSEQISCILKGIKKLSGKLTAVLTKDLVKSGIMKVLKPAAVLAPDIAGDTASAATGALDQCAQLCCPIGIGAAAAGMVLVAGIEIFGAYRHIQKYKKKLKENECDQETFENERVGAIAKCCFKIPSITGGGVAGTIAGGAVAGALALGSVGNFVVPIVGGIIGTTLGALIGWGLGAGVKYGHAKYQQWKVKKSH